MSINLCTVLIFLLVTRNDCGCLLERLTFDRFFVVFSKNSHVIHLLNVVF